MIQYFIVKHNNYSGVGMDFSSQDATQPISDDQDLAKALAGVLPDELKDEATPDQIPGIDSGASNMPSPVAAAPTPAVPGVPAAEPVTSPVAPAAQQGAAPLNGILDGIKRDALEELRPLVDRVSLPAEEKFDIYLMLIRSTDDSSLVGLAHAAAQGITDEKRKAEALLEIIKEIDYLSRKEA